MSETRYDCIFIPGGGLLEDGSLPAWTVARLERALELADAAEWIIPLSAGTVHKPPPLDRGGYPLYESRQAAAWLAAAGVDRRRVLAEVCSYDTIGNAYFSRTLFADPLGLTRCHLITSEFHLLRAAAAFRWVYSLRPALRAYRLSFEGVPDAGLDPGALAARRAREARSLESLKQRARGMGSLAQFRRWLYREHAAYAMGGKRERLSAEELESY